MQDKADIFQQMRQAAIQFLRAELAKPDELRDRIFYDDGPMIPIIARMLVLDGEGRQKPRLSGYYDFNNSTAAGLDLTNDIYYKIRPHEPPAPSEVWVAIESAVTEVREQDEVDLVTRVGRGSVVTFDIYWRPPSLTKA